jgi:hypothetical protein
MEYWNDGKRAATRSPQHSIIPLFQDSRKPLGSKWAPVRRSYP